MPKGSNKSRNYIKYKIYLHGELELIMVSYRASLISHNHGMWLRFLQGLQFDVKIGGKIRHVLYGGVTLSNWLHPLMLTRTTLFSPSSPLITSQHCLRGAWLFNYFSNVLDTNGFTDLSKISNSRCLLCINTKIFNTSFHISSTNCA